MFIPVQLNREGVVHCRATVEEVFPLLCPKKEEEWIPGWECETIWSKSGYNEEGAIFRTTKPYGTELYWNTLQYDMSGRIVDFLLVAPHLFMMRYKIELEPAGDILNLHFSQAFTSVSEEGNSLLKKYKSDGYDEKLKQLESLLSIALKK